VQKIEKRDYIYFTTSFILRNISLGMFLLVFNLYFLKVGLSAEFLGAFLAIGNITMCIVSIPIGTFIDKYSKKFSLILFSLLSAISILVESTTTNKILLIVITVIYGISFIGLTNITPVFLMGQKELGKHKNLLVENRAYALISMTIGSLLGGYISKLSIPFISQEYRPALYFSVILYLLSILPCFLIKEHRTEKSFSEDNSKTKKVTNDKMIGRIKFGPIIIFSGIFLCLGFLALLTPYFNLYFKYRFDLSVVSIAYIISIIQVVMSVIIYFSSKIAVLESKIGILIVTAILIVLDFLLILPYFILQLLVLILFFSFANILISILTKRCLSIVNDAEQGKVTGIINTAYNLTETVGIYIGGNIIISKIFTGLFVLNAILLLGILILLCIYLFKWRNRNE
jgi:predicted MFS family arabinose efflux permease